MSFAVVKPSMPGMCTSSRIAAKSSSCTLRSASSPEPAVTRRAPMARISSRMPMREPKSSSTMRTLAPLVSFIGCALACQHHQRIAAEHAHRRLGAHAVDGAPRPLEQRGFPAEAAKLGPPRRVEMVEDFVARVLERRERGLAREMMQVPDRAPCIDERLCAQHVLHRELERDVKDLVAPPGPQAAEEPEVVLDMLEDVDRHHHVELDGILEGVALLVGDVRRRLAATDLVGRRRNVVADEACGRK